MCVGLDLFYNLYAAVFFMYIRSFFYVADDECVNKDAARVYVPASSICSVCLSSADIA